MLDSSDSAPGQGASTENSDPPTNMTPLDGAIMMAEFGLSVFRCAPGTKKPAYKEWQKEATDNPDEVRAKWSDWPGNFGARTGSTQIGKEEVSFVVLDFDTYKPGGADQNAFGPLPRTFTLRTASGGTQKLLETTEKLRGRVGIFTNIDVRAEGNLIMCPGSIYKGGTYRVIDDGEGIAELPAHVPAIIGAHRERTGEPGVAVCELDTDTHVADATSYLQKQAPIAIEGSGGDLTTYKVACEVLDRGVSPAVAFELMAEHWNERCEPPWDGEDLEQKITNAVHHKQGPIGQHSVEAKMAGFEAIDYTGAPKHLPAKLDAEEPESVEDSEDQLALEFVRLHGDRHRYDVSRGDWFQWDDHRWRVEKTLHAFDLARDVCRRAAVNSGEKPPVAKAMSRKQTVVAVETLARADRRIVATGDQWDRDPWLLATPGGYVDLRTGAVRPANPQDYCTRLTRTAPADSAQCPTWLGFLNAVFDANQDQIAFVQRAAGYSLAGITREHAMFFMYGTGSNGKSTFVNTLSDIMGEYAKSAAADMFQESFGDRHPTELADLQGARLVTAHETEEGRPWAEAKLKRLTGGDRVKARFMRQDFFEYLPQFKLWVSGNHQPGLQTVDAAMRRRLHLIPFPVKFDDKQQDKTLPDRLLSEAPGILRWLIDGCLDWQRQGLAPPRSIRDVTDRYLESQDVVLRWIAECCDVEHKARTTSAALYLSYSRWCENGGEKPKTHKWFSTQIEAKGFKRDDLRDSRGFIGPRVRVFAAL